MGLLRVIHPRHFDPSRGNFQSLAFREASDGSGISVFDKDCALQASGTVYNHIQRFYPPPVSGEPIICWEIPVAMIPNECQIVPVLSESGDDCHYDLRGWPKKAARSLFVSLELERFALCTPPGLSPLSRSDLAFT